MKNPRAFRALAAAIVTSAFALAIPTGIALVTKSPPALATVTPLAATANAETGRRLYLMNCAACHGDDARGDEGPDLHDLHRSDERIHDVVSNGIKGEMPSFRKKLEDADIVALTAFIRTLHH